MTSPTREGHSELDATTLLRGYCAIATFEPGAKLRVKGNHYRDMYLITKGRAEVQLQPGQAEEAISVGPGSPVGEIGFLNGSRAMATVVAKSATEALVLDDETLWRIEQEDPNLVVFLLTALARTAEHRVRVETDRHEAEGDPSSSDIEVLYCRNDEQLMKAQRLRYQVYCEELGRSSPYADHETKTIRDSLDDFGHTFLAVEDGAAIGTLRCNFSSEGSLGILEQLYGMETSPNHPEHTMICTKFIVSKSKRKGPASMSLLSAMARYAIKEGTRDCFIDSIPALVPMYERMGFRAAGEEFFHYENGTSLPMVFDVVAQAARLAGDQEG